MQMQPSAHILLQLSYNSILSCTLSPGSFLFRLSFFFFFVFFHLNNNYCVASGVQGNVIDCMSESYKMAIRRPTLSWKWYLYRGDVDI